MMIINPQEDMNGTQKENIFLAISDSGDYLTHAYVHPYENHHTGYLMPRNIVIGLVVDEEMETQNPGMRQVLFDACLKRAYDIKSSRWPDEKVRIYGGLFAEQEDLKQFFIRQGFVDDDAVLVLRRESKEKDSGLLSEAVVQMDPSDRRIMDGYIERHNATYVKPIDEERFQELASLKGMVLLGLYQGVQLLGECMLFEKEGEGYVENFYICPQYRGNGYANLLMNHIIAYFEQQGYTAIRLEVWQRNQRALHLYQKAGFEVIGKSECYPGITLG